MEPLLINFQDASFLDMLLRVGIATLLGMIVGLERSVAGKAAGMRTFALVSLGACLFVLSALSLIDGYNPLFSIDPTRVIEGVATGIGFLGAGVIIFQKGLHGLTTAAGLWVTAGIGASVGLGLFPLAAIATLSVIAIFLLLWYIEEYVEAKFSLPQKPALTTVEKAGVMEHTEAGEV